MVGGLQFEAMNGVAQSEEELGALQSAAVTGLALQFEDGQAGEPRVLPGRRSRKGGNYVGVGWEGEEEGRVRSAGGGGERESV